MNDTPEPAPDYAAWIEPSVAYARVHDHFKAGRDGTLRWLGERLKSGLLTTYCGHFKPKRGAISYGFLIPADVWEHWAMLASEVMQFWNTGDITLYGERGDEIGRFFEVRFDPELLPKAKPQFDLSHAVRSNAVPVDTTDFGSSKLPRKQDLPQLPEPVALAWAAWFSGSSSNPTQTAAEQSASNMFPNHNLSRDRIRDLIAPAKQGRRSKSGT